jgi:hypothetical protein
MSVAAPSAFERLHFDSAAVTVNRNGLDISRLVGYALTDDDIAQLAGAPGGATIDCVYKPSWTVAETGADRPDPGLYFYVHHTFILGHNCIGLCLVHDGVAPTHFRLYVKDVSIAPGGAPPGFAGVMVARMARACLRLGVVEMKLLAAGGRLWPDMAAGQRWGGFVAWVRYGFDMPLLHHDVGLLPEFPHFPAHLSGPPPCATAQDVVKTADGMSWWKVCGNGHFMTFDCSNPGSTSIAILDSALASKGI